MFAANNVHRNAISDTPRRIIARYRSFMLVRAEPQNAPAYYEYYALDGRYLCCATRSASYVLLRLRTAKHDGMALCATPYAPHWHTKRLALAARATRPTYTRLDTVVFWLCEAAVALAVLLPLFGGQ